MNRALATALLVLGGTGIAHAEPPETPSYVAPFLGDDDTQVLTVKGAFGPAKDTTIVVTHVDVAFYRGFALVPDAKAKHGYRRLPLPAFAGEGPSGGARAVLIANLDRDPDDELVIEYRIMETVSDGRGNGYSYGADTHAVLDWDGKKFVHLTALEKKLTAKRASKQDPSSGLTEAEIRAALGIARPQPTLKPKPKSK